MPSLETLVFEDARLIEEAVDRLQAQGMTYEDAIEAAVNEIDSMTADKALAYAKTIINLESSAASIKVFVDRQLARVSAKVNLANRLRQRMLDLLPVDFKAEDDQVRVRFQKNNPAVDDSKLLSVVTLKETRPDLVTTTPESYTLNKKAVLDALKAGEEIEGLSLKKANYSIRIS